MRLSAPGLLGPDLSEYFLDFQISKLVCLFLESSNSMSTTGRVDFPIRTATAFGKTLLVSFHSYLSSDDDDLLGHHAMSRWSRCAPQPHLAPHGGMYL